MDSNFKYITEQEMQKILQITQEFKKKQPYKGTAKEKYQKWKKYLQELSKALNIPVPRLVVAPELKLFGLFGLYLPKYNLIAINKFSVITLLHEYYHAIVHTRNGMQNEHDPYIFSQYVFTAVFGKPHGYVAPPQE
jgi:Zn-dependent peptidase ImmA (M78 family)